MGSTEQDIRSLTGSTHKGAPLAVTRAMAEDLRPYISGCNVAEGELPADKTVRCGMLGDQPCIRLLWGGDWTAETADGHMVFKPGEKGITLFFGPQTRHMPISVTGSFRNISIYLKNGIGSSMGFASGADVLDRVVILGEAIEGGDLTRKIAIADDYSCWIEGVEAELRTLAPRFDVAAPHWLTRQFDLECLASPDFSVSEFARAHGASVRTLERKVKRDFGITPKQVQRRARALDMAASLLGVVLPEEKLDMELRYFDQSHLIREMRHFFAMRPSELTGGKHPLLRLNVESRQARRFDVLNRPAAREPAPWRDPASEPEFDPPGGGEDPPRA